ncbi:subtilisin-like protease SBT1.7 [Phalaenopsis equestris]|uniref:subtilisin-like protease SBT1.7 n=1 Tax=Phalaenopsis equestris TaxID=78828 RepID=UPI0009E27084|nr:subtilisin-like protease SBT1.7 [Phalaenopsis equestris]
MPPAPLKRSGKCYWGNARTCNNKLLRAVAFRYGVYSNPYDNDGHGTHVASIATGNFVNHAVVIGQAAETTSGMASLAHLTIYKVMFLGRSSHSVTTDADAYVGIKQAIGDHVDVLQMSLGATKLELFNSAVAIVLFSTIEKRIVPCASMGNNGPTPSILANDVPWILTIGASSVEDDERGRNVLAFGAKAMILLNHAIAGETTNAYGHVLPASHLKNIGTKAITKYYCNTTNPTAAINPFSFSCGFGLVVARFWPCGGCGFGLVVARFWPCGGSGFLYDGLYVHDYFACAGIVALLRNKYPNWSLAAIKSVIMMTTYTLDHKRNPITDEFKGTSATTYKQGAGHIDPEAATNTGIIYE